MKHEQSIEVFFERIHQNSILRNKCSVERSVKRKAIFREENSSEGFCYEVTACITMSDGTVIAEIYDITSKDELRKIEIAALENARGSISCPVFIFFHCQGKWQAISPYTSQNSKQSKQYFKNEYGLLNTDFSEITYTDFSVDISKYIWEIDDISEIIDLLSSFHDKGFDRLLLQYLKHQVEKWFEEHHIESKFRNLIEHFFNKKDNHSFHFDISTIGFNFRTDDEDELFQTLLGKVCKTEIIRFTTLESLAALLQHQSHRMWSIASMNDKTECSYANQKVQSKESINQDDEDGIFTYCNNYIISCSQCEEDDLTMWRLYGNNTKGVAFVYDVPEDLSNDFYLAPVSYAHKDGNNCRHEELEFVSFLLNQNNKIFQKRFWLKRWGIWQRFFKSEKYALEQEVRLLHIRKSLPKYDNWQLTNSKVFSPYVDLGLKEGKIVFPLKIKKIILGPNCPESKTNKTLIQNMLKDMGNNTCKVEIMDDLFFRP